MPDADVMTPAQETLLTHVTTMVRYWSSEPGLSNVPEGTTKRDALEGLAFSLLVMLDGDTVTGGSWELRPVGYDGNVVDEVVNGCLHELWKPPSG